MEHVWCGEWIILDISIYAQKHNDFNQTQIDYLCTVFACLQLIFHIIQSGKRKRIANNYRHARKRRCEWTECVSILIRMAQERNKFRIISYSAWRIKNPPDEQME